MSYLSLVRCHGLFALYSTSLLIILNENISRGYLLTTTAKSAITSNQDRFAVGFGSTDECFVILIYLSVAQMHYKTNVLSLDNQNVLLLALNFIYHMCIFLPLQLVLIQRISTSLSLFMVCYNLQLFIAGCVVWKYVKDLQDVQVEIRAVLRSNENETTEEHFTVAQKHQNMFLEFNRIYGAFNLFVIIHSTISMTVQANVILMYIFNRSYRHEGTTLPLVFLLIWSMSSLLRIAVLCIASQRTKDAWECLEKKLGDCCPSLIFRALLLERQFTACRLMILDNQLLFTVSRISWPTPGRI